MRRSLVLAIGLTLLVLAGCGRDGGVTSSSSTTLDQGSPTSTSSVDIADFNFKPSTITVAAGTTVTWTNKDGFAHSVRAEGDSFPGSQPLDPGKTYSNAFSNPGTYKYFCGIHNSMTGTVVVK